MRSGSEAALTRARDRWDGLTSQIAGDELDIAQAIFSIADILGENPAIVAALEDSSRPADARANLVVNLFSGKTRGVVIDLLTGLARERWSESGDIVVSLEFLGAYTVLLGARREDELSRVEEELYVSLRTLRAERGLRLTLSDRHYPAPARAQLAEQVFAGCVVYTQRLLMRAVIRTVRGWTLAQSLTRYLDLAAELDQHIVASVTSAVPLTRAQENRLRSILTRTYNKNVTIHVTLDPAVIGGIRVHVGDDVIDGTLANRISALRKNFTN